MSAFKKILLSSLGFSLLFVACWVVLKQDAHVDRIPSKVSESELDGVAFSALTSSGLEYAVRRVMAQNSLGASDINKIDFSLENSKAPGDKHDVFKIFNPKGGGISPDFISSLIKISGGSSVVFTLGNKIRGTSSDETDLIMVITDPQLSVCQMLQRRLGKGQNNKTAILQSQMPNLTPHPVEVEGEKVVELPVSVGCVQRAGRLFFIRVLWQSQKP